MVESTLNDKSKTKSTAASAVRGFSVPLNPTAIEHELNSMWDQREESPEGKPGGVTHITLGNVVWFGSSRFLPRIRTIFSRMVNQYPCRIFLLEIVPGEELTSMEAYINAYCFPATQGPSEVCCEEIHLRFPASQMHHVKGMLLPLLVADVPSYFWYFSSAPRQYESILQDLTHLADVSINEVAFRKEPATGLKEMAEGKNIAVSLSWFRCAPLREQIASFFDDPATHPLIQQIKTLTFGWMGSSSRIQALTNACVTTGWLASKLGWKYQGDFTFRNGEQIVKIAFEEEDSREGVDCSEITSFELTCEQGDEFSLKSSLCSGQTARKFCLPSVGHRSDSRFIKMHTLDEAEALVQLLQKPLQKSNFIQAAEAGWQLLHDSLNQQEKFFTTAKIYTPETTIKHAP
ncbi:MAG: glucose-6-phosphate dehydrogenase assembly protein OpcA [Sumerlaeia bacterium]